VNPLESLKQSVKLNKQLYELKQESREQNPKDGPNGLASSLAKIGISDVFEAKAGSPYLSAGTGDSPIIIPDVSLQNKFGVVQKPPSQTPRPKLQIDVSKVKK